MSNQYQLAHAQELIRDGCYYEARQLLQEMDDPEARQMLRHLDMVGVQIEKPKRLSQLVAPSFPAPEKPKRVAVEPNAFVQNIESANGPVVVVTQPQAPSLLVQGLWFLFIGWWASQLAIITSYLLMLTIIFAPIGVMILNRLPAIVALRGSRKELTIRQVGGTTVITHESLQQHNIWLRSLYFVFFGWWLGLVLVEIAWLFMLTIIGMPVAVLIYDVVPTAISLRR